MHAKIGYLIITCSLDFYYYYFYQYFFYLINAFYMYFNKFVCQNSFFFVSFFVKLLKSIQKVYIFVRFGHQKQISKLSVYLIATKAHATQPPKFTFVYKIIIFYCCCCWCCIIFHMFAIDLNIDSCFFIFILFYKIKTSHV